MRVETLTVAGQRPLSQLGTMGRKKRQDGIQVPWKLVVVRISVEGATVKEAHGPRHCFHV